MVRRLLDLLGDMQALETSPQSSLRDVLRARTHGAHRSLDDSLAVSDPAVELDDYVAHLEGMWTFHAPLERRLLSSEVLLTRLPDLALRRRAHLAWSDLRALDRDPGKVPFPSCTPDLTSLATQLGVAYVLEGSTLGGAVLARRLGAQLGLAPSALRYLHGYGERTGERWRAFVQALDDAALDEEGVESAARAAEATFAHLGAWLHARGATRRERSEKAPPSRSGA